MTFRVQKKQCRSCIYSIQSPLDLARLEAAIVDPHMPGFFTGWRVCHHSDDVCCAGFWARWKNCFQIGQLAQRLGIVEYVQVDTLAKDDAPV